jgi:hypothetical protein
MPFPILILARVLVLHFAPKQFVFRNGQDLFHRVAEFFGWLLDLAGGCRHVATVFHAQPKRNLSLSRDLDLQRFVLDGHWNRFPSLNGRAITARSFLHGRQTDKDQNQHREDSSKQKRVEISEQCVHPASYAAK